jgi:hypothetical protein
MGRDGADSDSERLPWGSSGHALSGGLIRRFYRCYWAGTVWTSETATLLIG